MIDFTNKRFKTVLFFSIGLNVLFLGYAVRKAFLRYQEHTAQQELALKLQNVTQPETVKYDMGKNEVFTKLPNDPNEIILIGNSLTDSFEWHELFKTVTVKNRGINGDITKGVLLRLDEVVESKPKKVFLEIGINDLLIGYPVDTVFHNYELIIQKIRQESPQTKIYIQSLLPTNWLTFNSRKPVLANINQLNTKLRSFSLANKLVYIDVYSRFNLNGKLNPAFDSGDNLHLNGTGYLEWCKLLEPYIME